MELPPISDAFRLVVWVVVGAATAVSVFLGNAFEDNINYFFRKIANKELKGQGQAPAPIPWPIKMISAVLFLVVIVGTAFASAAPDDDLESFLAQSLSAGGLPGGPGTAGSTPESTPTSNLADTLDQGTEETPEAATDEATTESASFLGVISEWAWRENTEASVAVGASQYTSAIAVSPGRTQLLVAAGFPDGTLGIFELADGQLAPLGEVHRSDFFNRINDIEFVPDQQAIVTGSIAGDLSTWNYSDSGLSTTPTARRRLNAGINAIALSVDGVIAAGQAHQASAAESDDSSISFNLPLTSDMRNTYAVLNTNQKDIFDLVFTIQGELFVVGNAPTLVRFGLNEDVPRMDYLNATSLGTTSVRAILASPTDGTLAYVSLADETVAMISAPTEQKLQTSGLLGGVATAMAFHPDNALLAVGTTACTIKLLDAGTLEILDTSENLCTEFEQGWSKEIGSLAFSPDGNYLFVGTSAGVLVLNTQAE